MNDSFHFLKPIHLCLHKKQWDLMVINSAHKHIHTQQISKFYLWLAVTRPPSDKCLWAALQKNNHHPASETGEFKRSRMRLRLSSNPRNGCDIWLMLCSTVRLQPQSQLHQEPLNTVNQLPPVIVARLTKQGGDIKHRSCSRQIIMYVLMWSPSKCQFQKQNCY